MDENHIEERELVQPEWRPGNTLMTIVIVFPLTRLRKVQLSLVYFHMSKEQLGENGIHDVIF